MKNSTFLYFIHTQGMINTIILTIQEMFLFYTPFDNAFNYKVKIKKKLFTVTFNYNAFNYNC